MLHQVIFDPVVFRGLIAKYFIIVEIAFRKAEDPAWKEMINYCQPSFRVVGQQSVRADCLLLYEEKLMLSDQFSKVKSHVSLTADHTSEFRCGQGKFILCFSVSLKFQLPYLTTLK